MALALAWGLPLTAHGEVRVEGNPAAVHITTSQDSIADVLTALRNSFNLQHRSAIKLDAVANSTYSGPIDRVIANLLNGFNYVVEKRQDRIDIIILGRFGEVAIPSAAPKPSGILSRWR
jgi:hypothetical protein